MENASVWSCCSHGHAIELPEARKWQLDTINHNENTEGGSKGKVSAQNKHRHSTSAVSVQVCSCSTLKLNMLIGTCWNKSSWILFQQEILNNLKQHMANIGELLGEFAECNVLWNLHRFSPSRRSYHKAV